MCGLPFTRQSDGGNRLYSDEYCPATCTSPTACPPVTPATKRGYKGLSEVFERHIKNRIIAESISLPEIPAEVMARYPGVVESIAKLEAEGFPILPMMARWAANIRLSASCCLTRLTAPASPPSAPDPDFGVALERTVTELLQGRSLKDLDVFTPPTFDDEEVAEHANLETHFYRLQRPDLLGYVQAGRRLSIR